MEKFYQRLRRLRVERNKSVKDMASELNISMSTYRDWEYGRSIKGEPYEKISILLEVSLEELLTGRKSMPEEVKKRIFECEMAIKHLKKELRSFF